MVCDIYACDAAGGTAATSAVRVIAKISGLLAGVHRLSALGRCWDFRDGNRTRLDQRVGRIEQILPTLATKTDIERLATKAELRDEIRGVKVLIEDSRSDTRLMAEHLSTLMSQMIEVLRRLERIERR